MVATVKKLYSSHKGLLFYTFLNYIDKALVFLIPFMVLPLFKDKELYNTIEYIFSISAISLVLIDLGVGTYLFYGYRKAVESKDYMDNTKKFFSVIFLLYVFMGIVIAGIRYYLNPATYFIAVFSIVRTLFSFYLTFYGSYFRLKDTPAKVFKISICVNVATIGVLLICKWMGMQAPLILFFSSQTLFVLAVVFMLFYEKIKIDFKALVSHLKETLAFSWPIILNILLFMFVNSYGKIYAYKHLSVEEMYHLSVVQRFSLLIQLAHSSVSGYLAKDIFMSTQHGIRKKVFYLYGSTIIFSAVLCLVLMYCIQFFDYRYAVPFNSTTFLIIGYTLLWCLGTYFELYINRMNKNRWILYFSASSAAIFFFTSKVLGPGIFEISVAMCLSMVTNLLLILAFLKISGNLKLE